MNLALNDARNLALGLLDPSSGKWYNPTSDTLEAFDPTKHLKPATPVAIQAATPATGEAWTLPPGLFGDLKAADAGAALAARPNLVPVWFVMDAGGNPQSIADVWPNPAPFGLPVMAGGWGR